MMWQNPDKYEKSSGTCEYLTVHRYLAMKITPNDTFIKTCVRDTLEGLRAGISHFSGPSSVAVIYSLQPEGPLYIFDPSNLLGDHAPILRTTYLGNKDWSLPRSRHGDPSHYNLIGYFNDLKLDGVVSYGGKSATVAYQMWFTEHHPDLFTIGPTERWLEYAALRFSHDIANEKELYTGISGSFLKEYAMHAIHDHIKKETSVRFGPDAELQIYPILDAILGISKTREEGAWPSGELVFVEPRLIHTIQFLAQFKLNEQPQLDHHKHVRKLLQAVTLSNRRLVSDGMGILGISDYHLPEFCLVADFHGRIGFLKINEEGVCSFADGRYSSTTHQAKLFEVEEALIDYKLDASIRTQLFQIISTLVHNAQNKKHGCTLVLDLNPTPLHISGQPLNRPMDLRQPVLLELACALSKVDGALHIGADCSLYGFACLLDGHTIHGEDRARGARYNSALRFSTEHSDTLLVVVSADRPVSIIQYGMEFKSQSTWRSPALSTPEPMEFHEWLNGFA
jgi:hypothetical protein